ncbi:hypothetical protein F4802DRAFT_470245 [Xylaria palmicola]|nr:hypothetical protein F4802DRAFT_470245 [Xylaria palmicola]
MTMAPLIDADGAIDREQALQRLEHIYTGLQRFYYDEISDKDDLGATTPQSDTQGDKFFGADGSDPSITILKIISYLRDNDASRDVNWSTTFPSVRGYIADAHRKMVTGGLGFRDPNLRAALEDARVMVKVHLEAERRAHEKTQWTTDILRGQAKQERLLTYPLAFPRPEPDRARSRYRPMNPMPRPDDTTPLWDTTLGVLDPMTKSVSLVEVDSYVQGENNFFLATLQSMVTGERNTNTWEDNGFAIENSAYERYMEDGLTKTHLHAKTADTLTGLKDQEFFEVRGWQRAALQQCLNLFTSYENRVINTPWRRPVLPHAPPLSLPKDIAYVPRVFEPGRVSDEKERDPFSWLHWSSQHSQIVDFLATCQRRRYNLQSWNDFSASALPSNFRGPRIYRGFSVHDEYWLKIGSHLENLEDLLHSAWGSAPRPFLRAILRDIDAGRQENTGTPNNQHLSAEDDGDMHDRKRYWRRDIKRRLGIDTREARTGDDDFKLVDDADIAWLRYLCGPSRTRAMCDPSKSPTHNLAIIFDVKLQSYFNNLAVTGTPDSKALQVWGENFDDMEEVKRRYKPNTLRAALAYINGCTESELKESGETKPNPDHPNASYQFSIEEAEFICMELQSLGRCVYTPGMGGEPARVDRPAYNVHPEDRVMWRYPDINYFFEINIEYMENMVDHYDLSYGDWPMFLGNRPGFSRELEYAMDHTGPDFQIELERVKTQEKEPGTEEAIGNRRDFIKEHLIPEGLCRIGDVRVDSIENERSSPYLDDIASWEAVGAHLATYHEQHKQSVPNYWGGEPYHPQTPEKTAQFFRNLAYRAGRTLRYVEQIKERLQYLEDDVPGPETVSPKSLDPSVDLKEPRPDIDTDAGAVSTTTVVEKWLQPISATSYDLAIEVWSTTIQEGSGEVALLPPDINEVLSRADPDSSYQNPLKGVQDPYTVIREGIIDDCFQNRPTMYPGRLSGFKDMQDKAFQGLERPSLFEWATKDERRYQAPHTRRHFFNMQRWPPSRILPHRLQAIRDRKDEVARIDPSKPDQAYGILTDRVPIGNDKPVYAHPLIHHGTEQDNWRDFDLNPRVQGGRGIGRAASLEGDERLSIEELYKKTSNPFTRPAVSANPQDNTDNTNAGHNNSMGIQGAMGGTGTFAPGALFGPMGAAGPTWAMGGTRGIANPTTTEVMYPATGNTNPTTTELTKPTEKKRINNRKGARRGKSARQGLVPFRRNDVKFAPGPAVFPMGDTLLQKVLISGEINNAMYPERPFYQHRLWGIPQVLRKVIGGNMPLIPLVPPAAKSDLPRSNPRKRKMPIEFLNKPGAKKKAFRSDVSLSLQRGGNGGQFAAAVKPKPKPISDDEGTDVGGKRLGPAMAGAGKRQITMGQKPTAYPWTVSPESQPPKVQAHSFWTPMSQNPTALTPAVSNTAAANAAWGSLFDKMGPQPAESTSSLRVLPDPPEDEGKKLFARAFPRGWNTTLSETKLMFPSSLVALAFCINGQLAKHGLETNSKELRSVSQSPACTTLQPYMKMQADSNFDLHCVALLAQAFGDKHGRKIQLGVIQERPSPQSSVSARGQGKPDYAAHLVGSKYHHAPDKIVLWIRLARLEVLPSSLVNPYSNLPYNTYKGVAPMW